MFTVDVFKDENDIYSISALDKLTLDERFSRHPTRHNMADDGRRVTMTKRSSGRVARTIQYSS